MRVQSLGKADRLAVAVVGADIVPFGILKLLVNERLGQFLLSNQLFQPCAGAIRERTPKPPFVLSGISQNDRASLPALSKGCEHQVKFTLGATEVFRAIGTSNRRSQRTAQPRPDNEHGDFDRLSSEDEVDTFLERRRSGQRQVFPEYGLERCARVVPLQTVNHTASLVTFVGNVTRTGDENADRLACRHRALLDA